MDQEKRIKDALETAGKDGGSAYKHAIEAHLAAAERDALAARVEELEGATKAISTKTISNFKDCHEPEISIDQAFKIALKTLKEIKDIADATLSPQPGGQSDE